MSTTKYTPECANAVCAGIADGLSLRNACEAAGTKATTFLSWCNLDKAVDEQYAHAREARGLHYGDRIGEIADDAASGKIDPAAARAAIDGYKWTASRMAPKRLGDRMQHEVSGPNGSPVEQVTTIRIVAGDGSTG